MTEIDMTTEIERYLNEQLDRSKEILTRDGCDDYASYRFHGGHARAYRDILAHIAELRDRQRRGEGDNEGED